MSMRQVLSLVKGSTLFKTQIKCTQINVDPLQSRIMYWSYLYEQNDGVFEVVFTIIRIKSK